MEHDDVERIVRGVISDLGARFTVLDVEQTTPGWLVSVKPATGKRLISIRLPDGPPTAIRTRVLQVIEAELEAGV